MKKVNTMLLFWFLVCFFNRWWSKRLFDLNNNVFTTITHTHTHATETKQSNVNAADRRIAPQDLHEPCRMMKPSTPSRLICSWCRSRKDAALDRLLRMSSITSARDAHTAAHRASAAVSWRPGTRMFPLGERRPRLRECLLRSGWEDCTTWGAGGVRRLRRRLGKGKMWRQKVS